MLRKGFKEINKIILVLFIGMFFSSSALGAITGNNTFQTAYSFGYWQYHQSGVTTLNSSENDAYYSFRINKGDRISIVFSFGQEYLNEGLNLQILKSNGTSETEVKTDININKITKFPFIFENINGESDGQTFYIKVNRGNYIGNMVFSVAMENRIYSGNGTFDFVGTASNPGNPDILINPNGVDSSIVSVDLTNKSVIPKKAIVKSITTSGNTTPSKGGIIHKVSNSQNNIWYASSVVGSDYPITVNDGLEVKKIWYFRYNQKGTGASTMNNAKITIYYEYDETLSW
ncbi:hypothetical protein [Aliarcobacter thereius]|uniref:F5/8 type C domain-containing protein n=1 Tax=Aliarcobacter thereius TaxID=544718 RepID=A0A5R9HBF1_9BACT|nr:hypothetical protein [Aliarcobacter thereius]OCL93712.1 hypothetical protein AAX25_00031 [Aliarcobacter thereius]TLS73373.1 hypothetical protein FE246_02465 [Aliarcobacter thereius]TLT08763.1 hypothetical protein FE243_02355 [Aliarcobacter thereius]